MVISGSPCEKASCPQDTLCQVREGLTCRGVDCEPKTTYECVPVEKSGQCPLPGMLEQADQSSCQQDSDCNDRLKCCMAKDKKICSRPCPKISCRCSSNSVVSEIISSNGCPICTCLSQESALDVCSLPKEIGPCKAAKPRYYFDAQTKDCLPFNYGGCQGNENNFLTYEFCARKCMKSLISKNIENDECSLDKETGPCRALFKRFFFNKNSGKCEEFDYGGCKGNRNNFVSLIECQARCQTKKISQENICSKPKDSGPCRGHLTRYFFNKNAQKCQEFFYGGCQGNENNFKTMDECEKKCSMEKKANTVGVDVCSLPSEMGFCRGYFVKYFFSKENRKCEQFVYGGCGGNDNRFDSVSECEKTCQVEKKNQVDESECRLEPDVGPCRASIRKYYFNSKTNKCEQFFYGGCLGNANKFNTESECLANCSALVESKRVDVCSLDKLVGPCRGFLPRFFYNKETKKCEKFNYGGCLGNENNFESLQDCESKCAKESPSSQGKCKLDKESGPCMAYIPRFYFNSKTGTCDRFIYGGCQGNQNNFANKSDCVKECARNERCFEPKESGPCFAAFPRYFYNSEKNECELFTYGGCQGNQNNFEAVEECSSNCVIKQEEKPGKCPVPGIGICVEMCKDDSGCENDLKCCSNGCGHTCTKPV
ncbi:Kunitz Bovine pancreatic trypsin inhibitor domain [Brachionus plicatilis]|uniref:Kunitz Bovine pancreatic trypsin inhibitor domain n=1 Tax=Brachionus plicatilis TaxID=10195 RepID=A0A3M7RVZ2_BRAPC|nr:Kunitz Bovine pancreatic trypsin inhibitor domain [Brachionus plicatilis]